MSLPAGVINRPPVAAEPRAVLGSLLRVAAALLALLLPWVLQAAAQAPGLAWQRESAQLEQTLAELRSERRRLAAERAALLAPDRLRREARRLGLVPAPQDRRPLVLGRRPDGAGR